MDISSLIITISRLLNPLLTHDIYYFTVFIFFIANLSILVYSICKNKDITKFIKSFFKEMPLWAKIALILLILIHIVLISKIINPLNSLVYPGFADIHNAKYLLENGKMSTDANPYGLAIILAIIHVISRLDFIWIMTGLTAAFSIIIILLMMLLTFKLTKRFDVIFFAPILFIFSNKYLSLVPGVTGIIASTAFIILFVFICSFNIKRAIIPAIFATTILPYFRMENFSIIFIFILLLMINKYWIGWGKSIILYIMFMPHLEYISKSASISGIVDCLIGINWITERISTYYLYYITFFAWLLVPLAIGIFQKKEHLILPLTAAGQILTYILYQGKGPDVSEYYFLNQLGLLVILVGIGLSRISNLAKKYNWVVSATMIYLLIIHLKPIIALQEDHPIIQENKNASIFVNGTRYILMGDSVYVYPFKRFYNPSEIIYLDKGQKLNENHSDYDYVVFLTEMDDCFDEELKNEFPLKLVEKNFIARIFEIEDS